MSQTICYLRAKDVPDMAEKLVAEPVVVLEGVEEELWEAGIQVVWAAGCYLLLLLLLLHAEVDIKYTQ